ncbi:hypothetical protein LO771_06280 [Streptacidiphilus sp. ASG 303]|uniref:hypothetical protein n=1 Tax=Streptacidiphilus sp. ASG 303 TaxID=2896847 RepID=UPI001E648890|nr:hypothetical protein [Streptacidiphilus sp. ASG 303]MCD0482032.1 hypothetical protein [Streptacidiphilus sp. ASG 303]
MSTEIVELVEQAGPYLTAALGAYGGAVLTRAESAAADATANLGRRILHAVWHRRGADGRAALESAVQDAAEDTQDPDAAAALRQQIKRALRDDDALLAELADLLPEPSGTVTITASGTRAIAAHTITTAVTGDNTQIG